MEVDPSVADALKEQDKVSVIVMLKDESAPAKAGVAHRPSLIQDALEKRKAMVASQQQKVIDRLGGGAVPKIQAANVKAQGDFQLRRVYAVINGFAADITQKELDILEKSHEVASIAKDGRVRISLSESVPLIRADKVANLTYNSSAINGTGETVCVIDTGVDGTHAALQDRIVAQQCFCIGCCPNGGNTDTDADDDHGHGTHVIGTIVSQNNTYRGVAPGAGVVAIKALDSGGGGYFSDVDSGIDWCVANAATYNISVISMSLGDQVQHQEDCDTNSSLTSTKSAIDAAVEAGIFVAVASGNENFNNGIAFPACIANATSVGATDNADAVASFTNVDEILDVMAPGVSICSSRLPGFTHPGGSSCGDGTFYSISGTSMATPHIAGEAALLQQFFRIQHGYAMTPEQIRSAMKNNGVTVSDSGMNFNRTDVYLALQSLDNISAVLTYIPLTPGNNTPTLSPLRVNISSSETLTDVIIELNGTNTTLNGSGILWGIELALTADNLTYVVYGNDTGGNIGMTEPRIANLNDAPNITAFAPAGTAFSIAEPNNQSFNITFDDLDGNATATITWYENSSLVQSASGTSAGFSALNFTGNYTRAGSYNITAIVSDAINTSRQQWLLTVNNTNRAPSISSAAISNSDSLNRTNGTLAAAFVIADNDTDDTITMNETAWFNNTILFPAAANLTSLSQGNTTKGENWTFSVRAFDGYNWSVWVNSSNITIANAVPLLYQSANATINETTLFDANATGIIIPTDLDSDGLTINYSSPLNATGQWKTNTSHAGTYDLWLNATDGEAETKIFFTLTVIDQRDLDGDGTIDIEDDDDDNDGLSDAIDFAAGNASSINTTVDAALNVTINGTTNLSQVFNATYPVIIRNGSTQYANFSFIFSNSSKLDFGNLTFLINNSGMGRTLLKGVSLGGGTKTLYVDNTTFAQGICIKDEEIASFGQMTANCSAADETFISCPGSLSGYTCVTENGRFSVHGLAHSGIQQANDTVPPRITAMGPSGTLTSGSVTLTATTNENATCRYTTSSSANYSAIGSASEYATNSQGLSHTASISLPSASYTYYALCNDTHGNVMTQQNSTTFTVTIESSSSSSSSSGGGGGGGGGGGAAAAAPSEASYAKFITSLSSGGRETLSIAKKGIAFTGIAFTATQDYRSVNFRVFGLGTASEEITIHPKDDVYQYLSIEHTFSESGVADVVMEFAVSLEWIVDNDIERQSITLQRLVGKEWLPLDTTFRDEQSGNARYSAESSGFSYFAITGKKEERKVESINATTASLGNETAKEQIIVQEQPKPIAKKGTNIALGMIIIAAFVLAGGIAAFLLTREKKHTPNGVINLQNAKGMHKSRLHEPKAHDARVNEVRGHDTREHEANRHETQTHAVRKKRGKDSGYDKGIV